MQDFSLVGEPVRAPFRFRHAPFLPSGARLRTQNPVDSCSVTKDGHRTDASHDGRNSEGQLVSRASAHCTPSARPCKAAADRPCPRNRCADARRQLRMAQGHHRSTGTGAAGRARNVGTGTQALLAARAQPGSAAVRAVSAPRMRRAVTSAQTTRTHRNAAAQRARGSSRSLRTVYPAARLACPVAR